MSKRRSRSRRKICYSFKKMRPITAYLQPVSKKICKVQPSPEQYGMRQQLSVSCHNSPLSSITSSPPSSSPSPSSPPSFPPHFSPSTSPLSSPPSSPLFFPPSSPVSLSSTPSSLPFSSPPSSPPHHSSIRTTPPLCPPIFLPPPPPPSTLHSSSFSPPSSPFSLVEELETLLLLRGVPFQRKVDSARKVRVLAGVKLSLVDHFTEQLTRGYVASYQLHHLLESLQLSVSPTCVPPADMLLHLWTATTNLQVVVRLDGRLLMRFSGFLQHLLYTHPPGQSSIADTQYSSFLQCLGGGTERSLFAAWFHIKHLLSVPECKYFSQHIAFLVDLLLADFWAHVSETRSGTPWFVSLFWPSADSGHTSLPVRELLHLVEHQLHSYSGTEAELSVLHSCMVLIFLISTRYSDLHLELSQLARTLPEASFLLFLSLLGPHSLLVSVITQRSLKRPPRLTPLLRLMLHLITGPHSNSCTPTELVPVAVDSSDHDPLSDCMSLSDVSDVSDMCISEISETNVSRESSSSQAPTLSPLPPLAGSVTHSPSSAGHIDTANVKLTHRAPFRAINSSRPLSIKKSLFSRVVYRDGCPQCVKRHRRDTHLVAVGAASAKRIRLNCEN